jgi:hypothetical protein
MVLYEDLAARLLAVKVRDRLISRFKGDMEFEFAWWRFDYLAEPAIAREAASHAASADLMLVSLHQLEDVGLTVKAWFETWLSKRLAEEGALTVIRASLPLGEPISHDDAYLRQAARRANLDYLTLLVPLSAPQEIDELRVDAVPSATIDWEESPNDRYHSSHWGLNE